MAIKSIIQTIFLSVFFSWFICTDYMERNFRRNEIFHMRDMVKDAISRQPEEKSKTYSIVLLEALHAAGESGKNGPGRLRICLDARQKIDEAMRGAINGEGILSASVELWSIHDESISEFCHEAIRDRQPFIEKNIGEKR